METAGLSVPKEGRAQEKRGCPVSRREAGGTDEDQSGEQP